MVSFFVSAAAATAAAQGSRPKRERNLNGHKYWNCGLKRARIDLIRVQD
jgi:hypothetical protein